LTEVVNVLVVEDEPLLMMSLEEALQEGGFTVLQAGNGEEAVRLLERGIDDLRAVVTDVNLGNESLTGWDVARRARELKPNCPVLYVTANPAAEWTAYGVPGSLLVAKPFVPAQIVTAVSQLLTSGSGLPNPATAP
jgi:CheY-like chemotaxis protein